jgi:hypothetical protein
LLDDLPLQVLLAPRAAGVTMLLLLYLLLRKAACNS